jgi:hypothetical protein
VTAFPSIEDFKKFLLGKAPDEVVAENWSCVSCPLSTFLKATGVAESPAVNGGGSWSTIGMFAPLAHTFPLPDWAREFVYWIDRVPDRRVTAEDCLEVMYSPLFKPDAWLDGVRLPRWELR